MTLIRQRSDRPTQSPLAREILTVMTDHLDLDLLGMTGINPPIPRFPLTKITSLKWVIPVIILSPQLLDKTIPLRVNLTMTPIKPTQLQFRVKLRTFNRQPQIRPGRVSPIRSGQVGSGQVRSGQVSPIIIHPIQAAQPSLLVLLGVEPNQE